MSLTNLSPLRCCGLNPGLLRPARMFHTRTGFRNRVLNAMAMRRICPPPSMTLPSMVITSPDESPDMSQGSTVRIIRCTRRIISFTGTLAVKAHEA
uniref:Uncharacterized protein n=1 Tax=Ixodes ricinus TaxID=34613 RepID=A0A6B0U9W9_IXORI